MSDLEQLKKLRAPFADNHISYKPVPTKAQTEALKADYKIGIRCKKCGGWHHKDVDHLEYVGHAAITDRLLDVDPLWNWEPVSLTPDGQPAFDRNGGLWIKLTVCGHTRLGYGDAEGKSGGNAIKEVIGDALRNAAMRFGAALDLWHKGDLHGDEDEGKPSIVFGMIKAALDIATTIPALSDAWNKNATKANLALMTPAERDELTAHKDRLKAALIARMDAAPALSENPFEDAA